MARFGFDWRRLLGSKPHVAAAPEFDLRRVNENFVSELKEKGGSNAETLKLAIGGAFDEMGGMHVALLRHYGLKPDGYLIDAGCGAGRTAQPLSRYLTGRYLGFDVVTDLVNHARQVAGRPDWRFEVIDHIGIPEQDGVADMVCFFSVFTHLLHEQTYWYLEEALRVLKPGGRIVFSFLEFRDAGHWSIFMESLINQKARSRVPLNVFMDREGIQTWANHLGLQVVDLRAGHEVIVPEGAIGQSVGVLAKPA
jgi:SAM-dependent methyltransferase